MATLQTERLELRLLSEDDLEAWADFLGDPEATTGSVAASVGAAVAAYERGATILRAHDVREHVEALAAARAALA
jgi:dihydropteroate synthase